VDAIVSTNIDWKEGMRLTKGNSKIDYSYFRRFRTISIKDEPPIPMDAASTREFKEEMKEKCQRERMYCDMMREEIIYKGLEAYLGAVDNSKVPTFDENQPMP
jgi:hypothetical protein